MSHLAPKGQSSPYEPHPNNLIRDRRRMRSQYGPYGYTRGMYVNGAQTPLKPRNIRIRSSIPIFFAVGVTVTGVWFWASGGDFSGALLMFGFAAFMHFLGSIGFRTACLCEKWGRGNPELAKIIDF